MTTINAARPPKREVRLQTARAAFSKADDYLRQAESMGSTVSGTSEGRQSEALYSGAHSTKERALETLDDQAYAAGRFNMRVQILELLRRFQHDHSGWDQVISKIRKEIRAIHVPV